MKTDVLVIGAGMSGLTLAVRLAEAGAKVTVIGSGAGSLGLSPATIDVLGYGPEPVRDPIGEMERFVASHPGHPYGVVGIGRLTDALKWFQSKAQALGYQGPLEENKLLPTALGALRPSLLVPDAMTKGALEPGQRVLIASVRGFRDFYPQLVAANLSSSGLALEARSVELAWPGDHTDLAPQRLWRRLEEPEIRGELASALRPRLDGEQAVGLPAILGRGHSGEVRRDLEDRLGRPVFEIPTLPPSLLGLRLFDLLSGALRHAGGRLILGGTATGFRAQGSRVATVISAQAERAEEYQAGTYVLATGGAGAGGVEVDGGLRVREPIFGLPLAGVPEDMTDWFEADYFAHHPFDRVGVRVDASMRPVDKAGNVLYDNLFAVGAELAGAEPWREKSGEGISVVTAHRAASAILEEGP